MVVEGVARTYYGWYACRGAPCSIFFLSFFLPLSIRARANRNDVRRAHRSQIFGSGSLLLCSLQTDLLSNKKTLLLSCNFNYTTYLILFNYVGRRYPAVNIVILTPATFNYAVAHALGRQPMSTAPPQDNSPDCVISIKDMKEWESHWDRAAPHNKLVRA